MLAAAADRIYELEDEVDNLQDDVEYYEALEASAANETRTSENSTSTTMGNS